MKNKCKIDFQPGDGLGGDYFFCYIYKNCTEFNCIYNWNFEKDLKNKINKKLYKSGIKDYDLLTNK